MYHNKPCSFSYITKTPHDAKNIRNSPVSRGPSSEPGLGEEARRVDVSSPLSADNWLSDRGDWEGSWLGEGERDRSSGGGGGGGGGSADPGSDTTRFSALEQEENLCNIYYGRNHTGIPSSWGPRISSLQYCLKDSNFVTTLKVTIWLHWDRLAAIELTVKVFLFMAFGK